MFPDPKAALAIPGKFHAQIRLREGTQEEDKSLGMKLHRAQKMSNEASKSLFISSFLNLSDLRIPLASSLSVILRKA